MTNKLENITADEIKLNEDGDLELSNELQAVIAGGISPEEAEEEDVIINKGCNIGCQVN